MEHCTNITPHAEADSAPALARGVCRLLADMGYDSLTEFRLKSRRRADVIGLDGAAGFVIVEVKSSLADYRADAKWPEYRPFCDAFYFAVAEGFPVAALAADCGVMVADA
ncbi:MAG: MmcB family DNA repair protein, partial [Rhodospirillales bacterium]|nr:MmcB family DNA repair protein [Rhodospirillales bacterium]